MLGWLTTCCGAVVVVVPWTTGAGPGEVVVVTGTVDVVVCGCTVVVVGGLVVVVDGLVVVVDGFGTSVVVVVAAPAPAAPSTPRRGPHTMTAIPARAIFLGKVDLNPICSPLHIRQHSPKCRL